MTRFLRYALIVGGALMSILLFFLTTASENSSKPSPNLYGLLVANAIVAVALLMMVLALLWRLFKRFRQREFGSRLMTRLVILFAIVGILPGAVIYGVSVRFVSTSIESWFNVKVESLLNSGLNLGHTALEYTLNDLEAKAKNMAAQLGEPSEISLSIKLSRLREQMRVQEATIVNSRGRLVATASENTSGLIPELPNATMLRKAKLSRLYSAIDTHSDHAGEDESKNIISEAHNIIRTRAHNPEFLRVIVTLQGPSSRLSLQNESLYLQLIQPVPEALDMQAKAFSTALAEYEERSLSRNGLKSMYLFTLTLTLLLAVFGAITSAVLISSELARPLLLLAEGTKAVAEGNLSPRPITTTTDELGSLTQSFNIMTRQLFDARSAVEKNRTELENAKAYLESVLANMSAGVMVLDQDARLVTCNHSVERILQRHLDHDIGKPLVEINGLQQFAEAIDKAFSEQHAHSAAGGEDEMLEHWQQQIDLPRPSQAQFDHTLTNQNKVDEAKVGEHKTSDNLTEDDKGITLLARGSHLPVASGIGYVIVFDDISNIISAQRSIAWGEVARRLAHEIKNPLTPIQLSAERLQMKLQDKLSESDIAILNKSTSTIVNQVTSMKRMVDDFRDYARTPQAVLAKLNLSVLIDDVLHMYLSGDGRDIIHLHLVADLPAIMGDSTQLRQVIHNLLQNAQDAVAENKSTGTIARIDLTTEIVHYTSADKSEKTAVRLTVMDNGTGFSPKILARAFEPYATSKPRGTGLGLAMVKKIVDEHGGRIDIQNRTDTNGAKVSILLLKLAPNLPANI